jgi:hypothetical protein
VQINASEVNKTAGTYFLNMLLDSILDILKGDIDALNSTKLDINDQRYNETSLIINLTGELNLSKLDKIDQRYNETLLVLNLTDELWLAKLNVTDQRYNNTLLILNLTDELWLTKLNVSDQRYNDTALIYNLTNELWLAKLNTSDQRYNDTLLILNLTDSLGLLKLNVSDQRYNDTLLILNLTDELWIAKLNISDQRYNDTLLIINLTDELWIAKLNITDQRFNETQFIYDLLNMTLQDYYNKTESDARYRLSTVQINASEVNKTTGTWFVGQLLDSILDALQNAINSLSGNVTTTNERIDNLTIDINTTNTNVNIVNTTLNTKIDTVNSTIKIADWIWIYNDSTYLHFNESKLNSTVYQLTGIFEENVTISISGGTGTGITVQCCSGYNEILQLGVFPTTITNSYKFSANTTLGGEAVDSDRATHNGNWIIAHSGSVVIGDTISYKITNAAIDEQFIVWVRYQK